jgi:hypothetical protein
MPTLPLLCFLFFSVSAAPTFLEPADTEAGYIARLLVNETPFPGERGWVSEADTKAAMLSILWVLHGRIHHVPPGYKQRHIAATESRNIIDVITVGGVRGQCDGFYRDDAGHFVAVPRVHERIAYLEGIAGDGKPGRFARLLQYAQGLATSYSEAGPEGVDRYATLHHVDRIAVTGRAYAWMTNADMYSPGGNFVRIPDDHDGVAGGNRFFTLRRLQ